MNGQGKFFWHEKGAKNGDIYNGNFANGSIYGQGNYSSKLYELNVSGEWNGNRLKTESDAKYIPLVTQLKKAKNFKIRELKKLKQQQQKLQAISLDTKDKIFQRNESQAISPLKIKYSQTEQQEENQDQGDQLTIAQENYPLKIKNSNFEQQDENQDQEDQLTIEEI